MAGGEGVGVPGALALALPEAAGEGEAVARALPEAGGEAAALAEAAGEGEAVAREVAVPSGVGAGVVAAEGDPDGVSVCAWLSTARAHRASASHASRMLGCGRRADPGAAACPGEGGVVS